MAEPKKQQKRQQKTTVEIKEEILSIINHLDPSNRIDARKLFQFFNLIRTANFSVDRDAAGTIAVPYNSDVARDLITLAGQADGIIESLSYKMMGTGRTINFAESIEVSQLAQAAEKKMLDKISDISIEIEKNFDLGYGSKRDIARYHDEKADKEKEIIKENIKNKVPLESFIDSFEMLSSEKVAAIYKSYVVNYINENIDTVKKLESEGASVDDIAKNLGVSADLIEKSFNKIADTRIKSLKDEFLELVKKGKSPKEIAASLKFSEEKINEQMVKWKKAIDTMAETKDNATSKVKEEAKKTETKK
jgi:transposase